ncbi:MAG: ATP synthase F1 subunit delta [Planctomycetota bacterium]|nr:ATP synthase F1 subunit delta [Planctomycetota bacterium]MDA1263383.1 ATP synthase F1 subunit delta [Planctomycetota bacterium]
MSSTDKIATVYANALLELAVKEGGNSRAQEIGEELDALCEVIGANKAFVEFLGSPAIDRTARTATIDRVLKGRVSDTIYRFVRIVNHKGRLGHLLSMGQAYDTLLQKLFGKTEVDVYTVDGQPMGEATETLMREKLRAAIGNEAIFHYYADKSMIGGIKLRIADQLVDGSVATQLRRLQETIIESGGAAVRSDSKRFIA